MHIYTYIISVFSCPAVPGILKWNLATTDPVLFFDDSYNDRLKNLYVYTEAVDTEHTLRGHVDAHWEWDACCSDGLILGPTPATAWSIHFAVRN